MIDKAALWAYLGTFLALVAAGVGFPIPEELPIVFAGAMVGHAAEDPQLPPEAVGLLAVSPDAGLGAVPWGALVVSANYEPPKRTALRWWIMLPICILGVVISDGLLYGMGRFWGPKLFELRFMRRMIPPPKRAQIEQNFHQYGVLVLLFARFLPAIRSPIFIMAGVMRLSFTRFLLADGIYAIPGVTLLFTLAFWFGDQFRDLVVRAEGRVEKLRPVLILLALTGIAAYLVYHFMRHPVATGDPDVEMPMVGPQIAKIGHSDITKLTPAGENSPPPADGAPTGEERPAKSEERQE